MNCLRRYIQYLNNKKGALRILRDLVIAKIQIQSKDESRLSIDKYGIPLTFDVTQEISGCNFLQIYNKPSDVVKIDVNSSSRMLCSIQIVNLKSLNPWPSVPEINSKEGVPILTGDWDKPEERVLDYSVVSVRNGFKAALNGNRLILWFGDLDCVSKKIVCGRAEFLIGNNELQGICFLDLTEKELGGLKLYGLEEVL